MLIGDIIISARELAGDMPGLYGGVSITAPTVVGIASSSLPPGTYYIKVTLLTNYGESLPSAEFGPFVVGAGQGIQATVVGPGSVPSSIRVYFTTGGGAGTENAYSPFAIPFTNIIGANGVTFTLGNPSIPQVFGFPPSRNTGWNPDSDGRFISVGTFYRWINQALTTAAYVCEGIPDTSGFQAIQGQGMYVMPGLWRRFENVWFDGYPVAYDARSGAFYRNVLNGITFIGMLQTNSDRQVIEFQPQPNRTGGSTTVSVAVGINDTVVQCAGTASFGVSLGMFQVGTEICSYGTITGNGLSGCARGLGGTAQQAWPVGTPVTELNFRFGGLRLNASTQYTPGQAYTTLQAPPGWAPALIDYLVSKFKEAERKGAESKDSLQKFTSFCKDYLKGTKQTAGPRQLGYTTPAGDGYPSASSGGRIIVP